MDRYVVTFGFKSFRQRNPGLLRQTNIKYILARVAIKMAMLLHVWAKPGRPTLQTDLPDESALYQRVQAVIDRGHGNIGHFALGANKYCFGRGMIAFVQQHRIDMLALRRKPKAARRQALVQAAVYFSFRRGCAHPLKTYQMLAPCQYLE